MGVADNSRFAFTSLTVLALLLGGCTSEPTPRKQTADHPDSDVVRYRHPSASMEPTIPRGSWIMVDENDSTPERCDVVAYEAPVQSARSADGRVTVEASGTSYVKRVVALEDEVVEVRADGSVLIDGSELGPVPPGVVHPRSQNRVSWGPLRVPKGTVVVLGDDRDNSADSRVHGFIPVEFISGTVIEPTTATAESRSCW